MLQGSFMWLIHGNRDMLARITGNIWINLSSFEEEPNPFCGDSSLEKKHSHVIHSENGRVRPGDAYMRQ